MAWAAASPPSRSLRNLPQGTGFPGWHLLAPASGGCSGPIPDHKEPGCSGCPHKQWAGVGMGMVPAEGMRASRASPAPGQVPQELPAAVPVRAVSWVRCLFSLNRQPWQVGRERGALCHAARCPAKRTLFAQAVSFASPTAVCVT